MKMQKHLLIAGLLLSSGQAYSAAIERWYSAEQIEQGKTVFRQNCAVCHGQNAEETIDWKRTDSNGNYPPPPLNGSAHAWHHDLETLRRTIREGGVNLGGQMPAFEDQLDAEQIDSAIAFFQSKWPEDIYQRWAGRFESSGPPSLDEFADPEIASLTRLLRQRIGNRQIDKLEKTPADGVWQAQIGNQYLYLLDNGKYAMMGDLVNLESGSNLTEQSRRNTIIETVSAFSDEDLVVFPAEGESRATLSVFTDTSCPYCQKMHSEVANLQAAGITVRYLPYARGGRNGPGYETLKSVWCAEDRQKAMTDAKNDRFEDLPAGDCAEASMIDRGYLAGNRAGIRGTPALIKSNGEKIEGYVPYDELIPMLLQ